MSLPTFSTQQPLFGRSTQPTELFAPDNRYRLFAQKIYPLLGAARPQLAACYCLTNGRAAIEPVLLLAITLLQFLGNIPDRLALELARYHAGWALALNQALGDVVFDPTVLVRFRERLIRHDQARLAFATILEGLLAAGLVSGQHKQRLDSLYVVGKLARLNSLDCVRETLRLALQELEVRATAFGQPVAWAQWWERYVEHQLDPRSHDDTLHAKLQQAGQDAWAVHQWIDTLSDKTIAAGAHVQLLARVLAEHFELGATGQLAARHAPVTAALQNPHEPDATYACKGQGRHKKEVIGYKLQVAETVPATPLAKGEPTRSFLVAVEIQPAHASDEAGQRQVEAAQAASGLDKPPVLYVDAAYVGAARLVEFSAEGRQLRGPAQPAPHKAGRFSTADFDVHICDRRAVCPAGNDNTQCSRLVEEKTGRVQYRFEWSTQCHACAQRGQCLGQDQRHRTLVVGEHHEALQARRREQMTEAFQIEMRHRNAVEGTQSELVRGHGARQARYRGAPQVRLQNYFIGAACNVKRWIKRQQWELKQAARTAVGAVAFAPSG